jgi:hypothetical protein
MNAPPKRLLLIELNEFSVELLQRGLRELPLPNIGRMLAMRPGRTYADDRIEHHGLDPWVQWVCVHTGQPSSRHGVIHLGDTPAKLDCLQLWEALSAGGISSGIWGAMNSKRGNAGNCMFFLPDPWTFSEPAFPDRLNDLLALPRYYSRNYLDVSVWRFFGNALRLCRYALGSGALLRLSGLIPLMLRGLANNGVNNQLLFSLFDLFSATLFVAKREQASPQFSLIFLNSIAHIQHHRWNEGERLNSDLRFALLAMDRVLGILFASRAEGEAVVIMNALSQRNVSEEAPLVGYRQINPGDFLTAAGFTGHRVEQLMTNDAHVFFADRSQRDNAVRALADAHIGGKALFQAEADADAEGKLFYQIVLWDELPRDAVLEINHRRLRFFEHFDVLGVRTGAHVPEGQFYCDGIALPESMANYGMYGQLLGYFGVTAA